MCLVRKYLHVFLFLVFTKHSMAYLEFSTKLPPINKIVDSEYGILPRGQIGEHIKLEGNYSAYNQTCNPFSKPCQKDLHLVCTYVSGIYRCQCASEYIYVSHFGICSKIPTPDRNICNFHIECHASGWGSSSKCNKLTGSCECWDYKGGGLNQTILVDGACYIRKSVGDICSTNDECNKTISGDAFCKQSDPKGHNTGNKGSCECASNHVHSQGTCLPLATKLGDKCVSTQQCQLGALGIYSKCGEGGTCECYSVDLPTIYYYKTGKCYKMKMYNETCTKINECRASLGSRVECDVTDGYPETRVCHCPYGKVCRSGVLGVAKLPQVFLLGILSQLLLVMK